MSEHEGIFMFISRGHFEVLCWKVKFESFFAILTEAQKGMFCPGAWIFLESVGFFFHRVNLLATSAIPVLLKRRWKCLLPPRPLIAFPTVPSFRCLSAHSNPFFIEKSGSYQPRQELHRYLKITFVICYYIRNIYPWIQKWILDNSAINFHCINRLSKKGRIKSNNFYINRLAFRKHTSLKNHVL